ncbi:MAG TPA: sucrase ferredoxin [Gaiellaceae bacterium]
MTRCSVLSESLGEPLHATAPYAPTWLLVEEVGAWGRKAVREAGLGELEVQAKEHAVRVNLIRRPRRRTGESSRTVLVARCAEPTLERLVDSDLEALDPARLPRGEPVDGPIYLVCTNGRRDVCCGRAGAAVVRALGRELGDRLWETSHVGGHRFAANLVALPHGLVFGRLDPESATRVVAAYEAGRIELDHFRGRTTRKPEQQAVEHFARQREGLTRLHDDPGSHDFDVRAEPLDPPRPTSCGGEPERPTAWRATYSSPR